ncbi:PAS domain-containing protein [Kordiimonas gwangyangensis]|uniref:PAS domain-containing protein n=1 Tax=Kordiimonas gwangyangensis TaxID=288022 RepID=UPI00036E4929|nr:PAS domain-containing protein [Kordiimonas gwangyangensis]
MVDFALPRADHFAVFQNYYKRLAADAGGVPKRTAFNPSEIKDLLPFIFIIEFRSKDDLYVRLAGTAIEQVLRMSPTGQNYLDLVQEGEREFFREASANIMSVPCGGFFRRIVALSNGDKHELQSKCLPFADRDGRLRYMIGMTSVRADLRLTHYDPPVKDVSEITGFHYEDLGYGIPEDIPPLPERTLKS